VKYSKSIDRLSLQSQIRDIIASGAKCSVAISSNPQSHTHNVIASTAQAGRGNLYMPMVSPGSHLDCFVAGAPRNDSKAIAQRDYTMALRVERQRSGNPAGNGIG